MRVISGSAKGTKLFSPVGSDTRPTLDRVKEALFSMLLPYLNDSVVLDLFSGSGGIGIEALSRGASGAVFVDDDPKAISCIEKNLDATHLTSKATVIKKNAFDFICQTNLKFDIIFIDPPYKEDLYQQTLKFISENELLTSDGIIVVEWDFEFGFTDDLCGFKIMKEKKYGRVGVALLTKEF